MWLAIACELWAQPPGAVTEPLTLAGNALSGAASDVDAPLAARATTRPDVWSVSTRAAHRVSVLVIFTCNAM